MEARAVRRRVRAEGDRAIEAAVDILTGAVVLFLVIVAMNWLFGASWE